MSHVEGEFGKRILELQLLIGTLKRNSFKDYHKPGRFIGKLLKSLSILKRDEISQDAKKSLNLM